MRVDAASFVPIYEQIKKEFIRLVATGILKARDPLPSIRDLAAELIVNPNTVARAYRELEQEGLISTQKGRGSFVTGDPHPHVEKESAAYLGRVFDEAIAEARILMGVIPADGGSIYYKGRKIGFLDNAYKKEFGYVPEDPFFYEGMTVQGILNFNARFYPRWDQKKAAADLERFDLDPKARIRTLSRGLKLKLELAVALAASPEFLILDDPTSGLDVPTRRDFLRDIIRELAASGTTILFATHLVHELERIVDRLTILHGGRLILDEDFEKVKAETQMSLEDIFVSYVSKA